MVDGPVVGPYWSDIDSSRSPGHAVYALINDSDHTLVQQVNDFLSCHQNIDTELSWILVATWVNKCPDFDDSCTYEQVGLRYHNVIYYNGYQLAQHISSYYRY